MNKISPSRLIRSAAIMFAAVAAICVMSQDAKAQGCGYGGFGGGFGGPRVVTGYGGFGGVYGGGFNRGVSIGINTGFGGLYGGRGVNFGYSNFRPNYGSFYNRGFSPYGNFGHGRNNFGGHRNHWHR